MMTEIARNFWNYSPIASFTTAFKDGQERKLEDGDVPAWLDAVVSTPIIGRLPASMLSITSGESYLRALERVDKRERAYARLKAADVLEQCVRNGRLGGFQEGLKELTPELRQLAVRHIINGWRRYHMDPRAENLRKASNIKDPKLRLKARQWIDESMRNED